MFVSDRTLGVMGLGLGMDFEGAGGYDAPCATYGKIKEEGVVQVTGKSEFVSDVIKLIKYKEAFVFFA